MISFRSIVPLLLFTSVAQAGLLDLTKAIVLSPTNRPVPERNAVTMLVEEVAKRTQVRWERAATWPSSGTPIIAVGPVSALKDFSGKYFEELSAEPRFDAAEGYRIRIKQSSGAPVVFIIGNDARGVLFGVGQLLRTLRMRA